MWLLKYALTYQNLSNYHVIAHPLFLYNLVKPIVGWVNWVIGRRIKNIDIKLYNYLLENNIYFAFRCLWMDSSGKTTPLSACPGKEFMTEFQLLE